MFILNNTFIPYEYKNKKDALEHIISRCHNIKKSLRFVEIKKEHLIVRCPMSGDYLELVGEPDEITWVHKELTRLQWYRTTS